ncbi:hypothetical protein [Dysgonomonas macrotermitis]|uniref:Uncharacterized protein n=1 Tax=Dysgonomonas macrotermitis TaxID=1346286 RepID=A0A1M5J7I7_9BACT|nr:hypothetical protein [Dysgonomonas macrotermitis]SHG35983.1 hypothetical protein SAMN05444362_12217 [Dysgonomonas macrotermitis]
MDYSISTNEKQKILEKRISYDDLKKWNALPTLLATKEHLDTRKSVYLGINNIFDEETFLKWIGLKNPHSFTVAEVLQTTIHPHFKCWLLFRQELIPPAIMGYWGLGMCRKILSKTNATNQDYRYDYLLQIKQAWLRHEVSLGNLMHATRKAKTIYEDSYMTGNESVQTEAYALYAAMQEDPVTSYRMLFDAMSWTAENISEVYSDILQIISNSLQS